MTSGKDSQEEGLLYKRTILTFLERYTGASSLRLPIMLAAPAVIPSEKKSLLVESAIHYVRAVNEGETVLAEAMVSHRGRKIGRIDIKIYNETMEIVALMHMIFYIGSDDHSPKIV